MDEAVERMTALKRAYADIILNTSNEAAARILAAERRALSFQQRLFASKEEAVATMLRLKAVMEGKVMEVEKAARCQEKKIEELELQLGEAEDTIVDLREELKRVREELTMMKDVPMQQLSEEKLNDTEMACKNTMKEADNLDEPGNMSAICDKMATFSQKIETEAPKETLSPSISMSTEINAIEEKSNDGEAYTSTSILGQCKLDTSIKKESMRIKHCTERITLENGKKMQNQSVYENNFMQNFLCSSDDGNNSLLSRTCSKTGGHLSALSIQKDLEDIIEVVVASGEEVENLEENMDNCITDTNDLASRTSQTGTDRFLKYTFQRKRKRGCFPIKNDIVFPEKKLTLKPKSVDKQTSLSVPSKSIVVTDMPRNNRRVVQVARQLISLSEKRW